LPEGSEQRLCVSPCADAANVLRLHQLGRYGDELVPFSALEMSALPHAVVRVEHHRVNLFEPRKETLFRCSRIATCTRPADAYALRNPVRVRMTRVPFWAADCMRRATSLPCWFEDDAAQLFNSDAETLPCGIRVPTGADPANPPSGEHVFGLGAAQMAFGASDLMQPLGAKIGTHEGGPLFRNGCKESCLRADGFWAPLA
jgi:hypothetical protein